MATTEYLSKLPGEDRDRQIQALPVIKKSRSGIASPGAIAMMLSDALVILVAFVAAILLRGILYHKASRFVAFTHDVAGAPVSAVLVGGFILAYLFVAHRYGLYSPLPQASELHSFRLTAQASLNAGLLLCGGLYMTSALSVSRMLVILLVVTAIVALSVHRAIWRRARFRQYERGVETRNVVILGTNHLSSAIGQHIEKDFRLGYRLRGYVATPGSIPGSEVPSHQLLGGIDCIRQLTRLHFIDEVVIVEPCTTEQVIRLVEEARELGLDIRTISGYFGDLTADSPIEYLGAFPVVSLHRSQTRAIALAVKRGVDIALSLAALILVFPAMLAIALAIKIEGNGSIFYVSERIGKRGRVFPCFKFRTMVKDADRMKKGIAALNERDGILFKVTNDPRITRVGRMLRKYSLDELPQFLNVLRGEMSIVGPRPPIASEVEKYELEHFRRLEVLPGLTGLWQVQARQDSSFAKYIALDTAYVENWSFWLDLKILLRTAEVVVRGTGT
jgi:exopolysaccharide biosynthesis polyprenyl glycosylphosphotransferase